ncbi:hypothetical protein WJX64_12765 [Leifsonia sp. YIM 134122]|uniref:Uncharacterized protein n=1 Tax=Leifsonia stereocauli TaxID=3134136 RepID=A0ABU9W6F4_9MICO
MAARRGLVPSAWAWMPRCAATRPRAPGPGTPWTPSASCASEPAPIVTWSSNLYDLETEPSRLLGERADLTIGAGEIVHDATDAAPLPEAPPAGPRHCSAVA